MTDCAKERRSALESLEELTKIMDSNITKFEEEERFMRRKHSRKQHKVTESKRKSQAGHSNSSRRNVTEKAHKRSHHHLGSMVMPVRKSNEKKGTRSKPDGKESGVTGKNEVLLGGRSSELAHLSCSSSLSSSSSSSSPSSSSSTSTRVGRPRYSSGHRYCMAGSREVDVHTASNTSGQRRRRHCLNRESQKNGKMRRSRYCGISERRGRHVSRRRGYSDQRTKTACDTESTSDKRGNNLSRDYQGDCSHGNNIDDDINYKIDQGEIEAKTCDDVCWDLPEHLLDEPSKNLYPFTNDGGHHSGYPADQCCNSWSWREHDEQLYADYYYNYNQCYGYYYAYNDCYFYQTRPETNKPLYHPGHVVYDFIFEDKDNVVGEGGDIHMLYRKICQDVSHGNFSGVQGSLGFPYEFSGSHFFPPVLDNDVSNNGGIVEESSRRNELFPFQDPYAFPINKPDAVNNMSEGHIHPVCVPPTEDYSKFKAFLPNASEYSQRHAISSRVKQAAHNQKHNSPESSSCVEDAEFERAFKRIMMEQFSLFTNFTPEFSEWCLDSCDWDYGKAAWNFIYDPKLTVDGRPLMSEEV